jgi:hypothetical protein
VLALAILCSGLALDGTARAEVFGGRAIAGQRLDSAALSADLRGRAFGPDGEIVLGVLPSGVLTDGGGALFTRARIEAAPHLDSGRLRIRQELAYGKLDVSPLTSQAPPQTGALQPPPAARFVKLNESRTLLDLESQLARRIQLTGSLGWIVSGGADAAARSVLPLARTLQGHAGMRWAATRRDELGADASAATMTYSTGNIARIGTLMATWSTRLTRDFDARLAGGPALQASIVPPREGEFRRAATSVGPAASLVLRFRPERGFFASIGGAVAPVGDALSGDVVTRGDLRTALGWTRADGAAIAVTAIGSNTFSSGSGGPASPRAGDRFLEASLAGTWPVAAGHGVSAGLRTAYLSRPLPGQVRFQWAAFLAWTTTLRFVR